MLQSLRRAVTVVPQRLGMAAHIRNMSASPSFDVDLGKSFVGHCE